MKVQIIKDEWYPVYDIRERPYTGEEWQKDDETVDIPEIFIRDYNEILRSFDEFQQRLKEFYGEQK